MTGKWGALEVNGTLFASAIQEPVLLRDSSSVLELVNATGPSRTSGVEFFAMYLREPLTITLDYAYLHATEIDRKSTRLNSSHIQKSRMPSSA